MSFGVGDLLLYDHKGGVVEGDDRKALGETLLHKSLGGWTGRWGLLDRLVLLRCWAARPGEHRGEEGQGHRLHGGWRLGGAVLALHQLGERGAEELWQEPGRPGRRAGTQGDGIEDSKVETETAFRLAPRSHHRLGCLFHRRNGGGEIALVHHVFTLSPSPGVRGCRGHGHVLEVDLGHLVAALDPGQAAILSFPLEPGQLGQGGGEGGDGQSGGTVRANTALSARALAEGRLSAMIMMMMMMMIMVIMKC